MHMHAFPMYKIDQSGEMVTRGNFHSWEERREFIILDGHEPISFIIIRFNANDHLVLPLGYSVFIVIVVVHKLPPFQLSPKTPIS